MRVPVGGAPDQLSARNGRKGRMAIFSPPLALVAVPAVACSYVNGPLSTHYNGSQVDVLEETSIYPTTM